MEETPYKLIKSVCDDPCKRAQLTAALAVQARQHMDWADLCDEGSDAEKSAKAQVNSCINARDLVNRNEPGKINASFSMTVQVLLALTLVIGLYPKQRAAIQAKWNDQEHLPAPVFTLQFDMGNSSFDGDLKYMEIDTILRQVADRAGDGQSKGIIHDSNGNRIGQWELTQ